MRTRLAVLIFGISAACSPTPAPPAAASAPAAPAAAPAPAAGPVAPPTTDPDRITSAMSAAPDAVARAATIVAMDEKMQMRTLREGTNGFTCLPDMPHTPGADPMCFDRNGMEWAHAWMSKQTPPAGKMAFAYMLAGGSDASNTDPFATAPKAGEQWVETGPHVMVLNVGNSFAGYPTTPGDAKSPFVMFPGTPYAHLMLPVR